MSKIWNKKSRLWKFTVVCLALFELVFLIALFFFYNIIGSGLPTHMRDPEDFQEYNQWYDTVYRPEHPNAEVIVDRAQILHPLSFWGFLLLFTFLGRQEGNRWPAWKKYLLEVALFAALLLGWNFLLLPQATHYRLFHVLMPTQAIAIPLFLQLATHPDLPRKESK